MKDNLLQKLKALYERYTELEKLIADPATLANPAQYSSYMKERGGLSRIVQRYLQFTQLLQQKEEAERIARGGEDKELQHLALENAVVLPIARLRLTAKDLQAMSRRLAARRGLVLEAA
ncbi:MAG: PCRF domain-containing protein, partial [Candidatus Brocadiales bacterium]